MELDPATKSLLKQFRADIDSFETAGAHDRVIAGVVPGRAAELWEALRARHPETQLWPILRGEAGEPRPDVEPNPEAAFRVMVQGDIRVVLHRRLVERRENLAESLTRDLGELDLDAFARLSDESVSVPGREAPGRESWPTAPIKHPASWTGITDSATEKPFRRVELALVQVAHPYEALAWLGFGGWNECPDESVHMAVLREWGKTYGAVPAVITGDVLECSVAWPPQTEAEAMRLASEQWIYCDDIVGQGTQTVRRLAIEIWRSPTWFFWWD